MKIKRQGKRKVREALEFLSSIQALKDQQNDRSALTLLALLNLSPQTPWSNASAPLTRVTQAMEWIRDVYGADYAPNTRETIRRQTLHQFVQQGFVIENPDQHDRPINSPKWCYQISPPLLILARTFGHSEFDRALGTFLKTSTAGVLRSRHRDLPHELVSLPDGTITKLSAGGQNVLLRAIVEEFIPRFVRKPEVLLLGDAGDKEVVSNVNTLSKLGIALPPRGKSPDALVHDRERNWLVIIEAVTSHGPIDQKRKNELEQLLANSDPGMVFVTAFPDRRTFTRFQSSIAWETEVWCADEPDHMIHYNGTRFLGPY